MSLWSEILRQLINSKIEAAAAYVKIQGAIGYVNLVKHTRHLTMAFCLLVFCGVVFAFGLLMIPVALCLFMPWTPETKAIVGVSFGAAYIIIPLIVMMALFSEKRWMKGSKADEIMKEALK